MPERRSYIYEQGTCLHICVTFEFEFKYQHHWFTAHLASKSHSCLACSKTAHYSDANEPWWMWCMELDAVSSGNAQAIQASTRSCWSASTHSHAHYSVWMAWESRHYGGLRCHSPEGCGSFIVSNDGNERGEGLVRRSRWFSHSNE